MTLMLDPVRPPTRRPWWRLCPAEGRLFVRIVAAGAPVAFALGAVVGIFTSVPAEPALPGRTPATAVDTQSPEAPPVTWTSNRPALASTPEVRTPQRTRVTTPPPTERAPAAPVVLTTRTPPSQVTARVYWANCTQARDAGVADIPSGSPGYRPGLDRDGDGFGCDSGGDRPAPPRPIAASTTTQTDEPDTPSEWSPDPAEPPVGG